MNLTFGMFMDGARWSDKQAALGEVSLGPAGTLELLETRLGLTMPAVRHVRRVNQYLERMKLRDETIQDRATGWYYKSFEADPWATAEQMLAWRDRLTAGGWPGEPFEGGSVSPRLQALAALENWQFASADRHFDALKERRPGDGTAGLYAWRSESYIEEPPDPDWDGVSSLTEK